MVKIGEFLFPDQGDTEAFLAWRPMIHYHALAGRVLVVATTRVEGAWKAYCDAVPGKHHQDEWQAVAESGCELGEKVARVLFSEFEELPYAR